MARQVQIIRGTTEQNNNFTGATGAMTYVTDTKGLRVHDGSTQGGIEVPTAAMADYVIYWDASDAVSTDHSHAKPGVGRPTNARWYRYHKSGWVIQGGLETLKNGVSVGFPVAMRDTNYLILPGGFSIANSGRLIVSKTSTNFTCSIDLNLSEFVGWMIMGYAA